MSKGARRLSDWFIKRFGTRNAFIDPPFVELDEIASQFKGITIIQQADIRPLRVFQSHQRRQINQSDLRFLMMHLPVLSRCREGRDGYMFAAAISAGQNADY